MSKNQVFKKLGEYWPQTKRGALIKYVWLSLLIHYGVNYNSSSFQFFKFIIIILRIGYDWRNYSSSRSSICSNAASNTDSNTSMAA